MGSAGIFGMRTFATNEVSTPFRATVVEEKLRTRDA